VGTTQTSTSPKDQAFIDLGAALGNIDIGAQVTTRSGTGDTPSTGGSGLALGFHDLTTSYQELIILTSDNTNYTSNTIQISAKLDAAVGTAVTITVKMVATDAAGDLYADLSPNEIKNTPKMVTTLYTITPTFGQGLSDPTYSITTGTGVNSTT
jgi:hypothetical protein